MTEQKLKPCPFCGGKAETYPYYFNEWYIGCGECSCDLGVFDTKEEAIEAWNKRVPREENQDWFRSLPTKDKEKLFKYISEKCQKCGDTE